MLLILNGLNFMILDVVNLLILELLVLNDVFVFFIFLSNLILDVVWWLIKIVLVLLVLINSYNVILLIFICVIGILLFCWELVWIFVIFFIFIELCVIRWIFLWG